MYDLYELNFIQQICIFKALFISHVYVAFIGIDHYTLKITLYLILSLSATAIYGS